MNTGPYVLKLLSSQPYRDIPFEPSSSTPAHTADLDPNECFQYASCPLCHSQRARLSKQLNANTIHFTLSCPHCGYSDNDVSDY